MNTLKKLINRAKNAKKKSKLSVNSKSTQALMSACSALLPTFASINQSQPAKVRRIQNFVLIWLDSKTDEVNHDDYRNTITKLRQVVNTVNTFSDVNECMQYINEIKIEQVFMILSTTLGESAMPLVHNMLQVSSIYIYDIDKIEDGNWTSSWQKVRGVFSEISLICEALRHAAQECDQNSITMSFVENNQGTIDRSSDELDQSFMYTQILKEIVLTIDFEQRYIQDFIRYCRELFAGNVAELENVVKFEREYHTHSSIWWYSYQCFLFSMLNRALRTMELDIIIKMGFFVRDLHRQIVQLHSEQYTGDLRSCSFTVYRGQGMSQKQFDRLKKTQGGLLSFNNFLSTSKNCQVSLNFARQTIVTTNLIGVLFVMTIDPSLASTPFAAIANFSCYQSEEEILFSMHSIFRIGQIEQIDNNNRLWQVELTLTSDNDQQLFALTERMREEIEGSTGSYRLGELLIKAGQFNQAEELYNILLDRTTEEPEKGNIYYQLGLIKLEQGEYAQSITMAEKSLAIRQTTLPSSHPDLADTYNSIGVVYNKMGDFTKALSIHEQALQIRQLTLPSNHPDLATTYNNIGFVYDEMGEYSRALAFHEKALAIYQKTLPPNHPDLATCYSNIGLVYEEMGEYPKALSFHKKAHEIAQKTLPSNHPDLATCYNNIGLVYVEMGEYSQALSVYEKALEINQTALSPNHPDLAISYSNIGCVYEEMGDYVKALSLHQRALEIRQETLPPAHPDLAATYKNIGLVYVEMGEYAKALDVHEKSLSIYQKTLSPNHPDLAASYTGRASVYDEMGEYSTALSLHETALQIRRESLSPNHPDLADTYNNIGLVYTEMGEYSKALAVYEEALKIYQKTLRSNHPELATCYSNIGLVYGKMEECSKALSFHERALKIQQETLPPNHPDIADTYNNIGLAYGEMGDYPKALSAHEEALTIYQKSLHSNHPDLATCYSNIGWVYDKIGEHSKANSFAQYAVDIGQRSLSVDHPDLLLFRKRLASVGKEVKNNVFFF